MGNWALPLGFHHSDPLGGGEEAYFHLSTLSMYDGPAFRRTIPTLNALGRPTFLTYIHASCLRPAPISVTYIYKEPLLAVLTWEEKEIQLRRQQRSQRCRLFRASAFWLPVPLARLGQRARGTSRVGLSDV